MKRGAGLGRATAVIGLLWGLSALAPVPRTAGEVFIRYSGHVVEIDLHRGLLVVEELGRRGTMVRHEVRVEAETPVVTASRVQGRSTAFGEVAVSLVDVLVGDFVVVEGEDQAGQTMAHRVTIVETRRKP
jgi:hypothetical protein